VTISAHDLTPLQQGALRLLAAAAPGSWLTGPDLARLLTSGGRETTVPEAHAAAACLIAANLIVQRHGAGAPFRYRIIRRALEG
jgi:hypothetical protein